MLAVGGVVAATLALSAFTHLPVIDSLFEAASALSTTGLSTGVTQALQQPGKLLVTLLMFVGRIGTATAGTALALRRTSRRYRRPPQTPLRG